MATNGHVNERRAVIGNADNFWLYSSKGFDLTHPPTPNSPPINPSVTLETSTSPITVDPAKSALMIIDMQNFFLSSTLGRPKGPGHDALKALVETAIPACRKAGIRVTWLNWGLTDQDIKDMPPSVKRIFGFEAVSYDGAEGIASGFEESVHGFGPTSSSLASQIVLEKGSRDPRIYKGLGNDMGMVKDPQSGKEIDAGKLLMRDTFNAALYPPLDKIYEEGRKLEKREDVWIHKNRMSAMWGSRTMLEEFLEKEGIRTLFFTGVNVDMCVGGTLQDSHSKGYDCVLLKDGSATTSPGFAQQCMELNAGNLWGFAATCGQLADGVAKMQSE